jgi:hypothetical protein
VTAKTDNAIRAALLERVGQCCAIRMKDCVTVEEAEAMLGMARLFNDEASWYYNRRKIHYEAR